MWIGVSKTYAAGVYTDADWFSTVAAWLVANPGQLDVNHVPGVSLEWRSKAARPDRAQFLIEKNSFYVDPVFSPGWANDADALRPASGTGFSLYASTYATEGCLVRFAIDTFSGRAWLMCVAQNGWSNVLICDLLQRSLVMPVDCLSTNAVVNIDVNMSNGDMGAYSVAAYCVNNSGVRIPGIPAWREYYGLTTPVLNFQRPELPGQHFYPPGSPQKILLPYHLTAIGSLQPHGPLTIASYANGPGFTADEVLASIDDLQIEYSHLFKVALHSPLPANWTVAA